MPACSKDLASRCASMERFMDHFFRRMDHHVTGTNDHRFVDALNHADNTLDLFWYALIDTQVWNAGKEMTAGEPMMPLFGYLCMLAELNRHKHVWQGTLEKALDKLGPEITTLAEERGVATAIRIAAERPLISDDDVVTYIPRLAAGLRAFRDRYDCDLDIRETFEDADDLAVLVTKYVEAEFADADQSRYVAFETFAHGDSPGSQVMGLLVLLTALKAHPTLMPVIIGRLLDKLRAALEPNGIV